MRTMGWRGLGTAAAVAAVLAVGGCSSNTSSSGTTTVPVEQARAKFCSDLGDAIPILDRYGRIFAEEPITIGDVQNDAKALADVGVRARSSANDLADAIAAANAPATAPATAPADTSSTTVQPTTTSVLATKSPQAHLDAIDRAEQAWAAAVAGVAPGTTLRAATAELASAAFGVEQAYLALFVDAGCLPGSAAGQKAVNDYVTGLQQDLATLGFYTGAVDGIYGPLTVTAVKSVQASAGLPETGVVDPATERALSDALGTHAQQQALNVAALQGALTAAGFYSGPIDGKWSPAVEDAVIAYQNAQNLPPTGTVDPATLAALLYRPASAPPETTAATAAPTTAAPTTTAPTTTPPTTTRPGATTRP